MKSQITNVEKFYENFKKIKIFNYYINLSKKNTKTSCIHEQIL
jgi:hypothetical protein